MTLKTPRARLALRIVGALLAAAIVWMLVVTLRRDGPAALEEWRKAQVSWFWISMSFALALAGQFVFVVGWKRLLHDLDIHAPFLLLLRMFLVSNLGRYLPAGKVWQMGIVGMMASEAQLNGPLLAGTSLLQGIVGVAVGALLLFVTGGASLGIQPVWYALPVVGTIVLIASPSLLKLAPAIRAKAVAKVQGLDSVNVATMWALVWTGTLQWVSWGLALWLLARGLMPDPVASIATYIAAWTGPFLGGIASFFTIAGLGVRDGMMQAVFSNAGMPAGAAFMVVAIARVWATILEVVPALIVLAMRRSRGTSPATPAT